MRKRHALLDVCVFVFYFLAHWSNYNVMGTNIQTDPVSTQAAQKINNGYIVKFNLLCIYINSPHPPPPFIVDVC